MATRTLKSKYESYDTALSLQRQVLCYSKDLKDIYYTADPEPEPVAEQTPPADGPPTTQGKVAPAPVAAPAAPASAPSGPAQTLPDEPVKAVDVLRSIIAQKIKRPLDQISLQKAIKDMVGGKSTLQNEILGDLGKEFGSTPEKPEDTPLDELGAAMQPTFSGTLGKHSSSLVARMISAKMPGGFNITIARKYLSERWGLGPGRQDAALLLSITMEPPSRLPADADAKSFLDDVAAKYAAAVGVSLVQPGAGGAAGDGGGAQIDAAALEAVTKDQNALFKQQLELYARYLKIDLRKGDKAVQQEQEASSALQAQLDLWTAEHGDFYANGIEPAFDSLKARVYDSSWNWARQEALTMYFDIIFGRLSAVDRDIVARCIRIMNRSNPTLLEFMQYHIDHCPTDRGETYQLAKQLGQQLISNCSDVLEQDPVYKDVEYPTAPQTRIDKNGGMVYEEIMRPSVRKLEHYVKEMAGGGRITEYANKHKVHADLGRIYRIIKQQSAMSKTSKLQIKALYADVVRSLGMNDTIIKERNGRKMHGEMNGFANGKTKKAKSETIPFLHLKKKEDQSWEFSKHLTGIYLDCLEKAANEGVSFAGRNVLMTGAGAGSIGADVLSGLISGGAKVVITTSRFSRQVTEYYQSLYARYGARGSTLICVPFNQGSKQDVDALIEYIYDTKKGLGWDLDFVVPFAAIPENGREIDTIDSKSELAHRIMLTNLLRLLGAIKTQKCNRGYDTRPAQVILPLSPNHGTFGSDGLYSESKLALETLFNRWHSESWGSYLTICGAVIGWTRGTGLMSANNVIAEGVESFGVRTFSQREMAFNLLGLMAPQIVDLCQSEPIFADLNGGLQFLPNLKELSSKLRANLTETSETRRAVSTENAIEHKIVHGDKAERLHKIINIQPRANLKFEFPTLLPHADTIKELPDLRGMVDLERVVVVTGFAEVGPWGNSRTRWEMEKNGHFSLEGCVEMAWIMGLIKNFNGKIKGQSYAGWVDAKTGDPVDDRDVKAKYETHILAHSGIRLIEPELFNGYDPKRKQMIQELVIEHDLEPFETSKETALEYKREHLDKVEIFEVEVSGEYTVRFKKGATILVPKALKFDRLVAGQIPNGWDAKLYGIEDEIINQVDRVTLYVLVATIEALLSAGVSDPYEFYKYVHVSEVGNCAGSGVGGQSALRGMYKDRWMDKQVQKDILQESFINTMSAWVNMLLLSSSGPIKTPVGACATAVESIELGFETLQSGKAKICIVGGYDDFQEEGSFEFANMNATSNAVDEIAHGRTPGEMSRPTTTTRSGFMESHGSGIQIIMTAKLALEMGVPIYGIIALTATATDKIGRSVPAPGKGIVTAARETPTKFPSPLLDLNYRRRQLKLRKEQIKQWSESEYLYLQDEADAVRGGQKDFDEKAFLADRAAHIESEAQRQEKEALNSLGNDFYKQDARIAPIRGALATWGLTVDDIQVASFHGTSTVANDKNESQAVCEMLGHLGRKKGNALLGVFQKYLTGHPKGAAGAWMFNGVLQVLNSGTIPGNRNADNIDKYLEQMDYILYPNASFQTDGIKAGMVTSFGFGQKGALAIGIHPKYLYAALDCATYETYREKVSARHKKAYRYFHSSIADNNMFVAKTQPPYTPAQESSVYLNPLARVHQEVKSKAYSYPSAAAKQQDPQTEQTKKILESLALAAATKGNQVGVDVETIADFNISNPTFLDRNFTDAEREYCRRASNPQASFCGSWSAKEAVFKSLGVKSGGGGAELRSIEILRDGKGVPDVKLHGAAAESARQAGVTSVNVSISHSDLQAVAVAVAAKM